MPEFFKKESSFIDVFSPIFWKVLILFLNNIIATYLNAGSITSLIQDLRNCLWFKKKKKIKISSILFWKSKIQILHLVRGDKLGIK